MIGKSDTVIEKDPVPGVVEGMEKWVEVGLQIQIRITYRYCS